LSVKAAHAQLFMTVSMAPITDYHWDWLFNHGGVHADGLTEGHLQRRSGSRSIP